MSRCSRARGAEVITLALVYLTGWETFLCIALIKALKRQDICVTKYVFFAP